MLYTYLIFTIYFLLSYYHYSSIFALYSIAHRPEVQTLCLLLNTKICVFNIINNNKNESQDKVD